MEWELFDGLKNNLPLLVIRRWFILLQMHCRHWFLFLIPLTHDTVKVQDELKKEFLLIREDLYRETKWESPWKKAMKRVPNELDFYSGIFFQNYPLYRPESRTIDFPRWRIYSNRNYNESPAQLVHGVGEHLRRNGPIWPNNHQPMANKVETDRLMDERESLQLYLPSHSFKATKLNGDK